MEQLRLKFFAASKQEKEGKKKKIKVHLNSLNTCVYKGFFHGFSIVFFGNVVIVD